MGIFWRNVILESPIITGGYEPKGHLGGRGERILTFPPLLTSRKNLFLVISKGFTKGFTPCPNLLLQR